MKEEKWNWLYSIIGNMKLEWLICCLCGEVMEDFMESHNPRPFGKSKEDRCCSTCNFQLVIPARMGKINMSDEVL